MASNKHIDNDIQTFTMLFWDLFQNEKEKNAFKKIVFHHFAIINSIDDIIDEAPPEVKKKMYLHLIVIYGSFFLLFDSISSFYETIHKYHNTTLSEVIQEGATLFPELAEIPAAEAALLAKHESANELELVELLITILIKRSYHYELLLKLLVKIYNVSEVIVRSFVMLKAHDLILKDLQPDEMASDLKHSSFNIMTVITRIFQQKTTREVFDLLIKVEAALRTRIVEELGESSKLQKQVIIQELEKNYETFSMLMHLS